MSDKVKKLFDYDDDSNTAMVQCGTKVKETDPVQTECQWTFQIDTWSHEELVELACRSLTIDAQRKFRKGELDAEARVTRDDLASDRKRGPSKKQAQNYLDSLDPEAKRQFRIEAGLIDPEA